MKKSSSGRIFCSKKCASTGRVFTQERKEKISLAQRGISVLSRGRPGKTIPQEIREKIRQTKLGMKLGKYDFDVITKELGIQKPDRAVPLFGLIPDAIMLVGKKLIALEVEKKPIESDIRRKMKMYENISLFDEVRIVWYLRNGERFKEFRKTNGEWKVV
jgi:hypothetical protein